MRTIRLFFTALLTFAVLSAAAPAFSQDAPAASSHEQTAHELYQLVEGSNIAEAGADAMMEAMVKINPKLGEYRDVFRNWYIKVFGDKEFETAISTLYMKYFTEEELREMIAFYKTPLGQKALKTLPEIAKESAEIGAKRAEAHAKELQEMLVEAMKKKSPESSTENLNEKM